ncbi:hypothetical protein ERO13_A10G118400v2 [Gossypium hirsutum]|uniref:Protein RDM1 isoform X1 n=8 Tax=Gossypium TaxID=3633 RepID=A0A1U8IKU3_GOSHI|nr:protein RDM1 isoform X1 [Gossypium hirsutum]KAB1669918.1 hypothetical protein ES319_1Z215100v1 [Gossypium barbadense]KAG4179667.1 hypothetical protein ERO13_A10G118400v2 [Gossypium hirsutum]TYG98753.1 hypothetical protein ES288_A10G141400v1 [Gossypium darwinii]TYI06172.1 hypothetical protein ES332_A10G139300v1 [Gossypium tomentosum]
MQRNCSLHSLSLSVNKRKFGVNIMKRALPWSDQVDVISSDESSSSSSSSSSYSSLDVEVQVNDGTKNVAVDQPPKELSSDGLLIRKAEIYQEYMKQLPIPTQRGSVIPFTTWMGLGRSIKQLYGQPLHYLTNILLKQWDHSRVGSEDEHRPLDIIVHPCKAEATVWLVEELHRQTSSHHHMAKLWQSDPMHHAFIDSIFPQL